MDVLAKTRPIQEPDEGFAQMHRIRLLEGY